MKRYNFCLEGEEPFIVKQSSDKGQYVDADIAQELYNMLEEIAAWCSFKPWDENLQSMKTDIEYLLAKADGDD